MENIRIEDIRYKKILKGGSIDIAQGEFVLICGRTGSGKTTLLKLLKEKAGTDAGYVMQNPDNQIVCDKVYTELEFAASAGNASRDYVRTRIAETAAYFGISGMLDKEVDKLSGGEKQILNIACAMAANPKVLILDEACSMLDPIMSDRVADLLCNINREYGITVIMAEHRTDRVFANADKVVFINDGFVQSGPMRQMAHDMSRNPQMAGFLPCCAAAVKSDEPVLTKAEAIKHLNGKTADICMPEIRTEDLPSEDVILKMKNVSFGYDRNKGLIIDDLNLEITGKSIVSLLGENGCGKSTLALIACGLLKPYSGKVKVYGKNRNIGMLFQDMTLHFTEDDYNGVHPYDLSGGEKQLAALDMVFKTDPEAVILDEPTKGLDYYEKEKISDRLVKLKENGHAIFIITHDIEFAAGISDRMLLMSHGNIVCDKKPHEFCADNIFYTTTEMILLRMTGKI